MEAAGRNRGCMLPGGVIDLKRISDTILDEFREGRIGTISLERPIWNETGDQNERSGKDKTGNGGSDAAERDTESRE